MLIVGGGPTGVQVAGALAEMRAAIPRSGFPEIDPDRIQVLLLERQSELLSAHHPRLRDYTLLHLGRRAVKVRLNAAIQELAASSTILDDGSSIRSISPLGGRRGGLTVS